MPILTRVRHLPIFKHGRFGRAWLYYWVCRLLFRVRPTRVLILSDSRSEVSGNLEFIVDEIEARHPELDLRFMLRPSLTSKRRPSDSFRLPFLIATSKVIILDDYYPYIYPLRLRREVTLIQAWHAAGAFKKVGYSRRGLPGGPGEDSISHRGYTDAITSSEAIRKDYAEAFAMPIERVHALGVPRTDAFFDEARIARASAQVRERYGIAPGTRVVLFAPTFRGNGQRTARFDFDSIDWESLHAGLGDDTVMLVKFHPFVRRIPEEVFTGRPRFIDVSGEREINDLLFATDVLVTDYSSVIFEFALLRRPIVFHVPDLDEYQGSRDFYYPFESYLCGPKTATTEQLTAAIRTAQVDAARLDAFIRYFMSACDGASTRRFVDQLVVGRLDPRAVASAKRSVKQRMPRFQRVLPEPLPEEAGFRPFLARVKRFVLRRRRRGLVSVVMPAYNVGGYIEEAVRSVLDQSYPNLELIVVDDSSTDETPAVLERIAAEDRRLRLYRVRQGGPNSARNFGIRKARGEYLTFLDGDDVLLPGAYADMVRSIEGSGSDFVVAGYERLRGGEITPPRQWIQNVHRVDRIGIEPKDFPRIVVNAVQWSKLYRRSFWDARVGRFGVPGFYQDQPVSARAFARARKIDILSRSTVAWRVREDNSSMTQQLGTVANLRDRFRTGLEAVQIYRDNRRPKLARMRVAQLLRFDFGTTAARLVGADDEYWSVLVDGIRRLVDLAIELDAWEEVSAQHRVLFHLIYHDRRADAEEFVERGGRNPADHEFEFRGDDVYIKLPFWGDPSVPEELFRMTEIQKRELLPAEESTA